MPIKYVLLLLIVYQAENIEGNSVAIELEPFEQTELKRTRRYKIITENRMDSPFMYFFYLGVGTPAQFFRMLLDTGSSVTWISDKRCRWPHKQGFDPQNSSSFGGTFGTFRTSLFGSVVEGDIIQERLIVHHAAGVTRIPKFLPTGLIGLASTRNPAQEAYEWFDGVAGVQLVSGIQGGRGEESLVLAHGAHPNLLRQLFDESLISVLKLAFTFHRNQRPDGRMILGDPLQEYMGRDFDYIPFRNLFTFAFEGITLGFEELVQLNAPLKLDTGSPMVLVPRPLFIALMDQQPVTMILCGGVVLLNEKQIHNSANFKMWIEGTAFSLQYQQYTQTMLVHNRRVCYPIFKMSVGHTLHLGMAFLHHYTVSIEMDEPPTGRVGFALPYNPEPVVVVIDR